ncbi:TetR/AcrR family transcriptional regulator [Roseobacter sp. YSTF-M11]|uniref:TetR/AcrR family transcriptional regulator n=1 Tax=Roseobacter insulae TaxID=2859783 RepID=A0A9X1FSJ6_9RHOB|nr:TetR/AcrR family transcriptional regulator [Roseobacter insulae]MBW4706345.1 TetR/AcrR family transcriptional regulator [Roseobacter insulae]
MPKQTEKRARGRPASIDKTEILEAATQAFWRLGYDGASLGELTKATGVSRPTLYAAFGDKDALFDAALDHYAKTTGAAPAHAFAEATDIRAAVTAFLTVSAEGNTKIDAPSGCLIACCAALTAETTPLLKTKLQKQTQELTAFLSARFAREVARGALSERPTPEARAVLLGDFMRAQAVRARSGASRAEVLSELSTRVEAVLA